jgi:dihydrofolate reductase
VQLSNNLTATLEQLEQESIPEAFIIGGGKIFEVALPVIDYLYMTVVKTTVSDADVFFPALDHTQWRLIWQEHHEPDAHNQWAYTFQKFERVDL